MFFLSGKVYEERRRGTEYAHLLLDEAGKILFANRSFVELIQVITGRKMLLKGILGKNIKEVLGKETGNTVAGTLIRRKDISQVNGRYLIGDKLYQVLAEEVSDGEKVYYELFYFPITVREETSCEYVLQNLVYQMAVTQGYADTDWIKNLSDSHCQQLLLCLARHEHSSPVVRYCPYKRQCGFNPDYGWMQLDRRVYYRAATDFEGELYLKALKDREVPPALSNKRIACQALDLSIGGIKLQLKNIILPKKTLVKMVFAEFTGEGKVVWTQEAGEDCLAGIKFQNMRDELESIIIQTMLRKQIMVK